MDIVGRRHGKVSGEGNIMKVGYIGLGTMGAPMVGHMMAAGHALTVHDINRKAAEPFIAKGAAWADTPSELAGQSDVIFTCLPGPPEMEKIVFGKDGLLEGVKKGTTHFELTTNSLSMIKRIHAAMAERGVALLDAPVSGGPTGAKAAALALWISGDKAAYEKCKPVIDAIGNQQSYLGPDVGAGTIAKLSHNVGGYIIHALVAEVFSLGVKAGLDPVTLWQAIRNGAYNRLGTYDWATRKFLGGDVGGEPPGFALKLAHKDVSLALNMARELKVPMRLGNLALEDLVECMNRGWENKDARLIMQLQLERSGVELNVDKDRYDAAKKKAGL